MSRRLCSAILLLTVTVGLESSGRADGSSGNGARSRVALVRSSSNDPVLREASTRVRAELLDAGFEVVEVDRAPGDPRSEVEDAEPSTSSFATVAMNRATNGAFADVWISDHLTGKTVVRRLEVGAGPNATAVLAIRALELLRASLLEVAVKGPPSEPPMSAPNDVVKWIAPALPPAPASPLLQGTALGLGALALHGLSGIGLAVGPTISVSHGVGPWFARVTLAGPLVGPELHTAAGSATIRQELGALAVGVASEPKPLGVYAWVGAGAFDLHTDGSADAPYHGASGDVVSFLWNAGIGGLARIGPRIALTVDLAAVFLDPQPIVVIAGKDAGSAGAPSIGASLGLLVGL
ncbi:MAG: hypothetical protein ACLP1X_26790 [Polyangiaceae bacterium]